MRVVAETREWPHNLKPAHALALVCRRLRPMAQSVIFETLHVSSAKGAQHMLDVLEGRPDLARLVRLV